MSFLLFASLVRRSFVVRYRNLAAATVAIHLLIGADAQAQQDSAPIAFYSDLSADEESAPTESPGRGKADFLLERETLRFSWTVTYKGLLSPISSAKIYGPQRPGANAGPQIDLAMKGLVSPLAGSVVLSDAQVEYLLAGRLYVNITTQKLKEGELRGQIQRLRSGAARP